MGEKHFSSLVQLGSYLGILLLPWISGTQRRRLYLYAEVPQVSLRVPALPPSLGPGEIPAPLLPPTRSVAVPYRSWLHPSLRKDPAPVPCSHPRAPFLLGRLGSSGLQDSDPGPAWPRAATTGTPETQGLWNRVYLRPFHLALWPWTNLPPNSASSCFIKKECYL